MAIFDFILPDLAPEQYSSGEGTGYAKVMPSNAPDIFSQTQDLIDAELDAKKRDHEKDILNEKNRQAKLDEYVSKIQYDPKWEHARANFDQEVNNIGDFITEWRASGKPVNDKFNLELNKRKAKLNSMKGMNDKAFETYNKNMQTMLAGLEKDYTQKDIEEYDAAISKAYEDGGVEKGFEAVSTIRPLKKLNLIEHLTKSFPVAENESGQRLQTKPEELDKFAKLKWTELTPGRQEDVMNDLYLDDNIKEKTPEAAIKYFREQLELWDKDQVARPRASRSSGSGKSTTTPTFSENTVADVNLGDSKKRNLEKGDLLNLPLWTKGQNPVSMPLVDVNGDSHSVVVIDVRPYWTGSERKFQVRGIPMNQMKISGTAISDVTQVTPQLIEEYMRSAQEYPLSESLNSKFMEEKFPGITAKIKEQITRDRKRGKQVYWEKPMYTK